MRTDLEAERLAADAALAVIDRVRFPLALLAGWVAATQAGHWLVGAGLGIAVFFIYGRAESKRHDAAWAKEENEFIDTEY